jgi:hypothetical protein
VQILAEKRQRSLSDKSAEDPNERRDRLLVHFLGIDAGNLSVGDPETERSINPVALTKG